jgi:undecaprenyl-diphosphatase
MIAITRAGDLRLVITGDFSSNHGRVPDWLAVIVLGIVEGITEFLPISSTGHLLLVDQWLGRHSSILFVTVVQCGAVMAVILAFWSRVVELAVGWRDPKLRNYVLKLALAFGITGVGGLILKKLNFELPDKAGPVAWATLIGGMLIIAVEVWLRKRPLRDDVTWTIAALAGVAQLIAAVFPGTSRSGATILMALALGLKRPQAAEFSFLLGVPTLLAAGGLQVVSALKEGETVDWPMVLLGMVVSGVTAFVAVKWLLRFVQSHTFVGFGWYRIVLGVLILLFA